MVTLGMWGNALALRIPSFITKAGKLRPGMVAELRLRDDGSLVVRLATAKARRRAGVASEASSEVEDAIAEKPVVW